MLDLARDIIGSQPILTAFLAIGLGYLVGQISIFGFSLGAVRRPRARRLRAEGADHRPDRADRPDHVPLRHRHSLRPAILRRRGRRRAEVQSVGAGGVPGQPPGRAWPRPHLRHQDRPYPWHLCRVDDQHRRAPGRDRRGQEQGSLDRLLDRLPLRRHRSDPLHLLHDEGRETHIPRQGAALPHGRDLDRRKLCRPAARRSDAKRSRFAGNDGAQGRPQFRSER